MIEIESVSKKFGRVTAVSQVNLCLEQGQTAVIQGASGSGKSSLLSLICGLLLPDSGEIRLDGQTVSRSAWASAPHTRGIGIVFQKQALWPHMSVIQNIAFGINHVSPAERQTRVTELLSLLKLEGLGRRRPDELSGGEAQRVALARALAPQPPRLLLDEPLANLDADLRGHILDVIQAFAAANNTTLILVTHQAAEAARIGGRHYRMQSGNLIGLSG